MALVRELPDIPGNDILVIVPRVEGLQLLAGQGGLGVPQKALLCLATSGQGLKYINLFPCLFHHKGMVFKASLFSQKHRPTSLNFH